MNLSNSDRVEVIESKSEAGASKEGTREKIYKKKEYIISLRPSPKDKALDRGDS